MVLHFLEIVIWAAVYMAIPALDKISHWEEVNIFFNHYLHHLRLRRYYPSSGMAYYERL